MAAAREEQKQKHLLSHFAHGHFCPCFANIDSILAKHGQPLPDLANMWTVCDRMGPNLATRARSLFLFLNFRLAARPADRDLESTFRVCVRNICRAPMVPLFIAAVVAYIFRGSRVEGLVCFLATLI